MPDGEQPHNHSIGMGGSSWYLWTSSCSCARVGNSEMGNMAVVALAAGICQLPP